MKGLTLTLVLAILSLKSFSLTWDEPWQDKVIKTSEYFILGKILSASDSLVRVKVIKVLGGKLSGEIIEINSFYLLHICSSSGGHGPEFHMQRIDSCYFFIKKNKESGYGIATPTSGFAVLKDGEVYATYRHSYHQSLVSPEVYENTMIPIFNYYHDLRYDQDYIKKLADVYLSKKPAGFADNEIDIFFMQHAILESIYHLKIGGYFEKILPFLNAKDNFHAQVSAIRALSAYNTEDSKKELLAILSESDQSGFVKVMAVWALGDLRTVDIKQKLSSLLSNAPDESNGFGGNIMDSRVCTRIPTVKDAIEELISKL